MQGTYRQAMTLSREGGIYREHGSSNKCGYIILIPLDEITMEEGIVGLFTSLGTQDLPRLKRVFDGRCYERVDLERFLRDRKWDDDQWFACLPAVFSDILPLDQAYKLIQEQSNLQNEFAEDESEEEDG